MGCGSIHLALKLPWDDIVLLPAMVMGQPVGIPLCRLGRKWFQLGVVSSNLHGYLPTIEKALCPLLLPCLETFFHLPGLFCSSLSHFQVLVMRGKFYLKPFLKLSQGAASSVPLLPRAVCFCNYKQKE